MEDIRRGMNLGADDYITKPFYKDELLNVIQTRLKKAEARKSVAPQGLAAQQPHLSNPEGGQARLEKAFTESGRKVILDAGQSIVREGEHARFICRVLSGNVHLSQTHEYGRDYIIAELGPGEIFGIPSILERAAFRYTAKAAAAEATVETLAKEELLKLINTDRTVTELLMRLLANQVVTHGDRLVHQAYDSGRRRTALVLCDLHEKYEGRPMNLSREQLAQMVGSAKESVIRALSDFKRDGLLQVEGKFIQLTDIKSLRNLSV